MYTVCPKCALPLAVTAADLRAGQGYVRCGRCANVFNALLRLSEESVLAAQGSSGLASLADIEEMDKASATMSRPALTEPEPDVEPESDPELEPFEPVQAAAPAAQDTEAEPLFPEDEEEFFDPESTNPKIGIAPLKLIPPRQAERSQDFWHMDASPPSPPPAMTSEEPARDTEDSAEAAGEAGDEGVNAGVDEVVDVEPEEEFIDKEIEEAAEEAEEEEEEIAPVRGTGTFETIVLEGDTFLQTEETIPEEVLASEIANVSRRLAEAHNTAKFAHLMKDHFEDEAAPEAEPPPEVTAFLEATGEFKRNVKASLPADDPSTWFRTIKSWGDWRVNVGAVALALMFMLQALNHWRDDLAARPGWFGAMRHLSSMLGEPLHPNWDLGAYDVRQLGAAADSADHEALKVRLSLTNVGQRAQALPLIRLTLRDRYGKSVSRGELAPEQYLPADEHGQLMIRRDQRIDTEIRVLDPTGQVSSFELDVCVPAAGGGLRCAGDSPALSARQS